MLGVAVQYQHTIESNTDIDSLITGIYFTNADAPSWWVPGETTTEGIVIVYRYYVSRVILYFRTSGLNKLYMKSFWGDTWSSWREL